MRGLEAFDFDKDAPNIFAATAAYPELAMAFMTPQTSTTPNSPPSATGAAR